jgi:hypothetical protein
MNSTYTFVYQIGIVQPWLGSHQNKQSEIFCVLMMFKVVTFKASLLLLV